MTLGGSSWSDDVGAPTNGVSRAVSGDAVTNNAPVQGRADVRLQPKPRGWYEVNVVAMLQFWRKRVLLQRFDRRSRIWVNVRKLVLGNQFGGGLILVNDGQVKAKVPKGTSIRPVGAREGLY
jgi:hypothetical protein